MSNIGNRVLRDSLTVLWDKPLRTQLAELLFYLPRFIPKGSRKRQVMSPTPALVPTRPFTFFQLLRSQHLLLLLVLGLLTGTMIVPLLSSMSLAHFNNRLSRAASLFTTAFHTHTTTSDYCFHVAAACTNALATMAMPVAPLVFFPPLCGHRVPGHAGGAKHMAGGSQESHLAIKQTDNVRLLVLRLLLTHFHAHFNSQPSMSFTDWSGSGSIWWWYCGRWFYRLFSLAISIHLPLRMRDQAQDAPREKFSLSEVCAHNLDRREWRKMSHLDSMGLTVPTLPIICPFRLYRGCGFPFLASSWVTSCHLPLGFPFSATNCVFHCRASAGCLLGLLYLLTWWCGISLFHRVFFYHFFVFGCCVFRSTNLIDKNGSRKLPFSASNFDSQCRLPRHPWCLINLQDLSLFHMAVYHHLTLAGCDLNLANLIAKNGSWNLPFLASNCDIRCYIWLYFCLASGLSPLDRGFYHICNYLSVDCGGSIPPIEFWSWISSALTLDGSLSIAHDELGVFAQLLPCC